MFVGLSKYRLRVLSQSPSPPIRAHARNLALLLLTMVANHLLGALGITTERAPGRRPSPTFLAFLVLDPAIAAIEAMDVLARYGLMAHEAYRQSQAERRGEQAAAWEGHGSVLYHLGLATKLVTTCLTLAQHMLLVYMAGIFRFQFAEMMLIMQASRRCRRRRLRTSVLLSPPSRLQLRNSLGVLVNLLRAFARYYSATRSLKNALPDATPEARARSRPAATLGLPDVFPCVAWQELEAQEAECAICRERMASGKKLGCGHIFHLSCLRSWLEQPTRSAQSCPLCRAPLLGQEADHHQQAAAAAAVGGQQHTQARGQTLMAWLIGGEAARGHGRHGGRTRRRRRTGDGALLADAVGGGLSGRPQVPSRISESSQEGDEDHAFAREESTATNVARFDLGYRQADQAQSEWRPAPSWRPGRGQGEEEEGEEQVGPSSLQRQLEKARAAQAALNAAGRDRYRLRPRANRGVSGVSSREGTYFEADSDGEGASLVSP